MGSRNLLGRVRVAVLTLLVAGLVGCATTVTGIPQADPNAVGTAGPVTEIGPQSGAERLAAAQKLPPPGPFTTQLDNFGSSGRSLWPAACKLLTTEQVKAIVPGSYDVVVAAGDGVSSPDPTDCSWQLGGGKTGSVIFVKLVLHSTYAVKSFEDDVTRAKTDGRPVYDGLTGGTRCVWLTGLLACVHGNWLFFVRGHAGDPNPSAASKVPDTDSRELQEKWLVPVASLIGPVLG